jgi:hypothetical protein
MIDPAAVQAQRDAITQALVNNVSPGPRTPQLADPNTSIAAARSMPGGQGAGQLAGQAAIAPYTGGPAPLPGMPGAGLAPMGMVMPYSGPYGPQQTMGALPAPVQAPGAQPVRTT